MVWSVWRSLATDCNAGDGESWICRACRLSCSALCASWDFPRSEQWIRTNGINKKYPKIRSKGTATSKNGSQTVSSCRQLRQCFSPSQMLQRSAVSESENELLSFLFFLGGSPTELVQGNPNCARHCSVGWACHTCHSHWVRDLSWNQGSAQ